MYGPVCVPCYLPLPPLPSFGPMDLWPLTLRDPALDPMGPTLARVVPTPGTLTHTPPVLWSSDLHWTAWRMHYDLPLPPAALGVKYLMVPNMVPGPYGTHGPYGPYPWSHPFSLFSNGLLPSQRTSADVG